MRRLTLVVLLAALAGCGSSSGGGQTAATQVSATHEAVAAPALPSACSRRARAAFASGRVVASPYAASNGAAACRLRADSLSAIVLLDSAPQPYYRLEREVTEFGQNVDWTKVPPSAYPRTIKHLGLDANWFPLQSRLLTTDGVRLITIKLHGPLDQAAKRDLAVRLAHVYLGPLHKPPGY